MVVCLVAIGVGGFLYLARLETSGRVKGIIVGEQCRGSNAFSVGRSRARPLHRHAAAAPPAPPPAPPSLRRQILSSRKVRGCDRAVRRRPDPRHAWRTSTCRRLIPRPWPSTLRGANAFAIGQQNEEAAKGGRHRAMPETRRRHSVTAQMRDSTPSAMTIVYRAWLSRRCRRSRGSGMIRRSRSHSSAKNVPLAARRGKGEARELLCAGPKNQVDRGRSRGGNSSTISAWRRSEDAGAPNLESLRRSGRRSCMIVAARRCILSCRCPPR